MLKRLITTLIALVTFSSCNAAPNWIEGDIYATAEKNGTYTVLKILKLDDHGVHIRTYSNIYKTQPKHIDESALYMAGMDRKPNEALGMDHLPISWQSFSTWAAIFVQQSTVKHDELEGYEVWREAEGGYF